MKTMDDQFLYLLRQQPDPIFVKSLNRRLSQFRSLSDRGFKDNFLVFITNTKMKLALITVLVAVGLFALSTISPVRAFVSSLVIRIAGQSFEVTEDYPGDNYPGGVTVIEPQVVSLSNALALFPHNVKLPDTVTSGITLNEENVRVYVGEDAGPFSNAIEIEGSCGANSGFTLRINDRNLNNDGEIVAPDSVEEIILDGDHPAVLIRGGWDADKKAWDPTIRALRIRWQMDGLNYELMGTDLQQLVVIARSILMQ